MKKENDGDMMDSGTDLVEDPAMKIEARTESEADQKDEYSGTFTISLPASELRDLAQISGIRAMGTIVAEWSAILSAIWIANQFWNPFLYPLFVMFIGARQHALAVLQHDAAHFRLFRQRFCNDWIAELFLAWPLLLSNQGFRHYHFLHHRYLGMAKDGNRSQYGTHTLTGEITKMWSFPKSRLALGIWIFVRLSGVAGILYLLRSIHRFLLRGSLQYRLLAWAYYGTIVALIVAFHGERILLLYWIIPLCTWFILTNLLRIAGEHSALESEDMFFRQTRTTIPSWFDQIFIVPRNISYHLEHHLYPHIPFYRLPQLHDRLMQQREFRDGAQVTNSYWSVLRELTAKPSSTMAEVMHT
jgi:fatty acid desaturase